MRTTQPLYFIKFLTLLTESTYVYQNSARVSYPTIVHEYTVLQILLSSYITLCALKQQLLHLISEAVALEVLWQGRRAELHMLLKLTAYAM